MAAPTLESTAWREVMVALESPMIWRHRDPAHQSRMAGLFGRRWRPAHTDYANELGVSCAMRSHAPRVADERAVAQEVLVMARELIAELDEEENTAAARLDAMGEPLDESSEEEAPEEEHLRPDRVDDLGELRTRIHAQSRRAAAAAARDARDELVRIAPTFSETYRALRAACARASLETVRQLRERLDVCEPKACVCHYGFDQTSCGCVWLSRKTLRAYARQTLLDAARGGRLETVRWLCARHHFTAAELGRPNRHDCINHAGSVLAAVVDRGAPACVAWLLGRYGRPADL